jgi:alpha-N-arabinofuranosidase
MMLRSGLLLVLCLATPRIGAAAEAAIAVDAGQKASYKIPRTIFGTFHEPILSSNYGGLWAQILVNPSFEENLWSAGNLEEMVEDNPALRGSSHMGLPLPWESLHPEQGWRFEPRGKDAANSFRSLLVMALPEAQTGVRQAVYLPVQRVLRYTGYVYVKPVSGPLSVEVSIRRRNSPDEVLARASLSARGDSWEKHEFELELQRGALSRNEAADFVIALSEGARALIDQAILYPADHVDGLDPEMVRMARGLKTPLLRYGGNFTSGYHWRDGIGPMDERVSVINQAWGMPEYNHFGTDEYLRFCRLIGAEPQICLNLGSGTPEEAAGWVEYVNSKWNDGRGGLLWELGNELWGDWQIGYPTLAQLPERTKAFSDAVRRVDPGARLIATGQDPDRFEEWNAAQLTIAPGAFDYLSTHFVVGDRVLLDDPSPEFRIRARLALPVGLERRLRMMKDQIDAEARGDVQLAFTEWLFHGQPHRVPRFDNMGGALCTAGFLNTLMRVAEFTPVADMTGLIEFGGITKRRATVYGVPAYWAFRMYSNADVHTPVETRTEVESHDVHEGNARIPEIPGVPDLDVVSALNEAGDTLTLFCVNRKTDEGIRSRVALSHFPVASVMASELRASSVFARNDEWRPDAIRPRPVEVEAAGSAFEYEFPPASVTVLTLKRE